MNKKTIKNDSSFDEQSHPRDEDGKFTEGGDESASQKLDNLFSKLDESKGAGDSVEDGDLNHDDMVLSISENLPKGYSIKASGQSVSTYVKTPALKKFDAEIRYSDHGDKNTSIFGMRAQQNFEALDEIHEQFGPEGTAVYLQIVDQKIEQKTQDIQKEAIETAKEEDELFDENDKEDVREAIEEYSDEDQVQKAIDESLNEAYTQVTKGKNYKNSMKNKIQNASQYPRHFYARHMHPGIAGYQNETILVDTDAIKRMCKSFEGKPVYIQHQDVNLETLKEDASGFITHSFYNPNDGWAWCKFLAIDDQIYHAIAQGWSVSNAYIPTEWGGPGTKHNCNYDREVVNGEFTHLAIVPDPRYEDAKILKPEEFEEYQEQMAAEMEKVANSKTSEKKEPMKMLKMFKKQPVENENEVDDNTIVELQNTNGQVEEKTIGEMRAAVQNKKNEGDDDYATEDDVMAKKVNVDGEEITVKELANRYRNMKGKKNEDDGVDRGDEDEDAEKDNKGKKHNGDYSDKEKQNYDDAYTEHANPDSKAAKAEDDADEKQNAKTGSQEDGQSFENAADNTQSGQGNKQSRQQVADGGEDHFNNLKQAPQNALENSVKSVDTALDQLERGRQRY